MQHHHFNILNRREFLTTAGKAGMAAALASVTNVPGILRRAMPGTAILAVRSGVPVLPIVHWGGETYLKNLKHFKRTDFHLRVGEPFTVKVDGKVTADMRQQVVDEMMYKIAALMPEEYRGVYRTSESDGILGSEDD